MKLWDISKELLTAPVYPGDPAPQLQTISDTRLGDPFTVSVLSCCVHAGTHADASLHSFSEGEDVASLPLDVLCGECVVLSHEGVLLGEDVERMQSRLLPRVLLRGNVELSQSAAFVLSDAGVRLVGVENNSVANASSSAKVHRQLLGSGMILLENLDLSAVRDGRYFLFAAPLKIAGAEAAPLRAVLVER